MYVHTGGVSNAYSHIRTARARVHGEAADGSNGVVFIGSQPAWTEQPKRGLAYRRTEETGLLFDRIWSKRGPVNREGSGVPQNGGNRLVLESYGRNGVL